MGTRRGFRRQAAGSSGCRPFDAEVDTAFEKAVREAIHYHFEHGQPITCCDPEYGDDVVCEYPDGRRSMLDETEAPAREIKRALRP